MHCKYLWLSHTKLKFSKALYGTTRSTYSARVFRPVIHDFRLSLTLRMFRVKSGKSDGLRVQKEFSVHAKKMDLARGHDSWS